MPSTTLAGAFARNCSFAELTLAVADFLFNLRQFFFQALAFHGDVDLLFVQYMDIESRRRPGARQLRQRVPDEADTLHAGQSLDGAAILFQQDANLRRPAHISESAPFVSVRPLIPPANYAR